MAAHLTAADREEKKWLAWSLSLRGQHSRAIGRALGINYKTAQRLIQEAGEQVTAERAAAGIPELERALAEQDHVIAEGWKHLANTKDNSLNKSAILSMISSAYEKKHKLLGLLKDRLDVTSGNEPFTFIIDRASSD